MRIGITTHYYRSNNYGGNLQAYALCKVLEKLGHHPEQICYPFTENKKSKVGLQNRLNIAIYSILDFALHYIHRKKFHKRCKSMLFFNKELIPHSSIVYKEDSLSNLANQYELFVTGSDIVWGPKFHSSFFFLNFLPKGTKKISYAASLGTDKLTVSEQAMFKEDLSSYHAISVREKAVVPVLEKATARKINYCLDPTLLLEKNDWDEICSERIINDKYVFCYFLGTNENACKVVIDYADKYGLKVVNIPYLAKYYNSSSDFGDLKLFDVSPQKFLSLIKYAECVFTDSFHACVFSQIYHKNFFAFRRSKNDKLSIRITDFLSMLSLSDRYCGSDDKETIQYVESVNSKSKQMETSKLESLKRQSLDFLRNSLKGL